MQYLALFAKYNTFIMYHVTTYMSIIINIYFRGIDTLINTKQIILKLHFVVWGINFYQKRKIFID